MEPVVNSKLRDFEVVIVIDGQIVIRKPLELIHSKLVLAEASTFQFEFRKTKRGNLEIAERQV